jgi:hypothetical protein
MYNHDGDKSVTTIHEKAGKAKSNTYEGSPGVATFSLGQPATYSLKMGLTMI